MSVGHFNILYNVYIILIGYNIISFVHIMIRLRIKIIGRDLIVVETQLDKSVLEFKQ